MINKNHKNTSLKIAIFIIHFILMISTISLASPSQKPKMWTIINTNIQPDTLKKLNIYLNALETNIPLTMRERLKTKLPIRLEFSPLKGHESLLKSRGCLDADTGSLTIAHNKVALGKISGNKILLSQYFTLWLENKFTGDSCNKRIGDDYLSSTLIHETAHIYDLMNFQSTEALDLKQKCLLKMREMKGAQLLMSERMAECNLINKRTKTVSDDPQFLKLSDFNNKHKSKHRYDDKQLRPYEDENSAEYFAVQIEKFLLDPNYFCRRPAHALYLAKHFDLPINSSNCKLNRTIYAIDKYHTPIVLDPQRVYRIDYLFAGQGKKMMSRWGHAMYRIVMCAPARKDFISGAMIPPTPFGPDCLKDTPHHWVVSFRANIDDIVVDTIGGLFGKYDSLQYIMGFDAVLDEYNKGEFRYVKSIPLELNDFQKELFLNKVIENYWTYRGTYKFLSNNCADEALDIIKTTSNEKEFLSHEVISPLGLIDILSESHFNSDDETELYPSYLGELLRKTKVHLPEMDEKSLLHLLSSENAMYRSEYFKEKLNEHQVSGSLMDQIKALHLKSQKSALFGALSRQAVILYQIDMKQLAYKKINELEKSTPGTKSDIEEKFRALTHRMQRNYFPNLITRSYGVALTNEVSHEHLRNFLFEKKKIDSEYQKMESIVFKDEVQTRKSIIDTDIRLTNYAGQLLDERDALIQKWVQDLCRTTSDLQDCYKMALSQSQNRLKDLWTSGALTENKIKRFLNQ